jgi:hypothetical protein
MVSFRIGEYLNEINLPEQKSLFSVAVMSKRFGKFLTCVAFCFLCASVAAAQQRITGSVFDKTTGKFLPGINVKLESDLLSAPVSTTTGSQGQFSFSGLSPGDYSVSVSADTFRPLQVSLRLNPRAIYQLRMELVPIADIKEQVTVSAQEKLLDETETATITNLDAKEIGALPAARRSQLTDIVAPFVSGAVAGHDNLIHLRGNELSLNTFVNGVSFYDNPHQLFTPGISPDVIQSVNIFTGGFPAEFGNRFGGILDIVTRNGFDANNHGNLTLGAGTFLRDNLSFDYGGHTKKFGYFFYGQGFQSVRFLNTPEPARFHDSGKGSRAFAQFDYRYSTDDTFRLLLTGDGTNFEMPNTSEDELRSRDFFQRNREQTSIASWEHMFSSSSMLSTSVYERYVSARLLPTTDQFSIQAGGLRNDISSGIKSDYSLFIGSTHAIKAGIDLTRLRLREDFSFDPRDNEIEITPFEFRGRKTGGQGSIYFQDKIRLNSHFSADLGLRFDRYSLVTNGTSLSPRINLSYSFDKHRAVLHFSYNRFFAPPSIENLLLSARLGFDGLPPQISRSNFFEAGAARSFTNKFVLHVNAFWRSDKNSFENTELANVRIFAPTTFARGKSYGIEISGRLAEIPKIGVSGYFSYTAQRAFQTGPISGGFTIEDVGAGDKAPAAFDQIHTAVAGVTYREHRTGLFATTQFEYGSGTPASFPDENGDEHLIRLPGHFIANLYFGIDLFRKEKRNAQLQFNIENLSDKVFRIAKESEFTPVQYSPPRFLSGSLSFNF